MGEPMYVKELFTHKGGIWIHMSDCHEGAEKRVCLDNPAIDLTSPPLGYISYITSHGPSYMYACRMPARRQKQGLDVQRLVIYNPITGGTVRNNVGISQISRCILANYEGAEERYSAYLREGRDKKVLTPFSRDIAVSKVSLYYKTMEIGSIKHTDGLHIVTITSPSFECYPFKGVFNANWRFVRP
jgi:hypothetical protein